MLKYSWSVALLKGQVIKMSVVIIGGNERMEQQYKQICKKHKCKAKVFTRMSGNLKTQIGQPDLIILFTSTVAHKMVHCALKEAQVHWKMYFRAAVNKDMFSQNKKRNVKK